MNLSLSQQNSENSDKQTFNFIIISDHILYCLNFYVCECFDCMYACMPGVHSCQQRAICDIFRNILILDNRKTTPGSP